MPVTEAADAEPQIQEDTHECANGHNRERSFLNLIEKWDFKVIVAGTAVNVVTGLESLKIFQVWTFTTFQWRLSVSKLKKAVVDIAAYMPTNKQAKVRMTGEMKSTTTSAL